MSAPSHEGREWLVEAYGCSPDKLRDVGTLRALFDRVMRELALQPVGEPVWHRFPGEGGVTGLQALAESHLTCHSFPEHGTICINLFCCRPRAAWDWDAAVREQLGAARVSVRELERPYVDAERPRAIAPWPPVARAAHA